MNNVKKNKRKKKEEKKVQKHTKTKTNDDGNNGILMSILVRTVQAAVILSRAVILFVPSLLY